MLLELLQDRVGNQVGWREASAADSDDEACGELARVELEGHNIKITVRDVRRANFGSYVHLEDRIMLISPKVMDHFVMKTGEIVCQSPSTDVIFKVYPFLHEDKLWR
jgi:hypothetical protein